MPQNPNDIVKEYCAISSMVAEVVFKYQRAADCFCGENKATWGNNFCNYHYEPEVLDFILQAVQEKIASMNVVI